MDWSKAKNILIIAFMITNVFLIYHIEKDIFDHHTVVMLKENHVQNVVHILEEKNIKIEAQIPQNTQELPILYVEYMTYDDQEMKKLFLDPLDPKQELSILNNKLIRYSRIDHQPYLKDMDAKKARDEAEEFIRTHGFMGNDVVYWNTKYQKGQYEIIFKQKHRDKFLEKSYMKLGVDESGVIEFERLWLKPLKFSENKQEIIPATKALLKFMQTEKNVTIKDISLGYWLDPSQMGLANWENIQSGTAFPAWRITLQDKQTRFVIAYDNY